MYVFQYSILPVFVPNNNIYMQFAFHQNILK